MSSYEPAEAYRDTPCSDPQTSRGADQTPDEPSQQMLPTSEAVMEKRTETSTHSSRSGRVKREPSPKERKTKAPKSVKLQEPHKRKEKQEEEEERGEAKEAQIISRSTVVNVDSVRERIKEDREELLGLLETDGFGEGKCGEEKISERWRTYIIFFFLKFSLKP